MNPLDIIMMALTLGAVAGLKDSAEQAVKDLYFGFKSLIEQKYGDVNISLLEKEPNSKPKQSVVKEELEKTNIFDDKDVFAAAKQLLLAIQEHAPTTSAVVGLEMKNVTAGLVEIDRIIALEGTGAKFSEGNYENVHIGEVVSGERGNKFPKAKRR